MSYIAHFIQTQLNKPITKQNRSLMFTKYLNINIFNKWCKENE